MLRASADLFVQDGVVVTSTYTQDTGISRRLIGSSAILSTEHKVICVDLNGLVHRLLLFDKYVLASIRLQEFPLMLQQLGYERLQDLLASRLIEIRCECLQLAQTGQSGILGDPVLPPFSYKFHWLEAHDRKKYVHDSLKGLHGVARLQPKQLQKLKRAIVDAFRRLPEDFRSQVFPAYENELLHNLPLLRKSIAMALNAQLGLSDVPFSLTLHQESSDTFRIETDIHQRVRVSELEGHKIVEKGLLGIAGLSQRLGEMKFYSAISGFRDEELPLFRHKLDFLAEAVSSEARESGFQRVIDISGLPQFPVADGAFDVDKLLKVRDSSEAREFRDWLGGIGCASDTEIKDRVASMRAKAGLVIAGPAGKAMRFFVNAALSLIPGIAGPALLAGAFDNFMLERLLPRSGIAAFVNELYPSIFEVNKEGSEEKK